MLSKLNSNSPSFGNVTCVKVKTSAFRNPENPKAMIQEFSNALSRVAPDLKAIPLVEKFVTQDYYCPNITNVPMRQCDGDTNICVITGKEFDTINKKTIQEFSDEIDRELDKKYGVMGNEGFRVSATGKKTWGADALYEVTSSKIRALLNLEGKEVPVIKLNSLNDINPEVAEKLK